MEKRILLLCNGRNARIMSILGEQDPTDAMEFQTTIQMVQVVVNRLLTSGKKQILIDMSLLDKIYTILGQYEELLGQYIAAGRLRRLLNSHRMRRKLEMINSELHVHLKQFVEKLKDMNAKQTSGQEEDYKMPSARKNDKKEYKKTKAKKDDDKKKKDKKQDKKAKPADAKKASDSEDKDLTPRVTKLGALQLTERDVEEEEHEHLGNLSSGMIADPAGKDFWIKLFGEETFYVEWERFFEALSSACGLNLSKDDQALMKHVIDHSGTGHINVYKWSEFLKGFGPLDNIINNVRSILTAPWFYGFLTSREAELLLENHPEGTFLIRFSRSSGGSFALAFVQEPGKILHILVQSCMPSGFKIEEEEGDKSLYFGSLQEIVDHYSMFLREALTSELPRENWFHGDLSAVEAAEVLQGHAEGTFLIRFSSQPGCFAASYVAEDNEVKHALIQGLPQGGFLFAGEEETFSSLTPLIEAYSAILWNALPNHETEVATIVRKYLESKKAMKVSEDRGPIPNHYSAVSPRTWKKVCKGTKTD